MRFDQKTHVFKVDSVQILSSQGNGKMVILADLHFNENDPLPNPNFGFPKGNGEFEVIIRPFKEDSDE